MSRRPSTRQELYDRIRRTSLHEVILEEMRRHGFWPAKDAMPRDPADELARIGELEREIRALQTKIVGLHNEDQLKREAHKLRLKRARERREETKARREQERRAKAEAWARSKATDIVYLGPEVSSTLNDRHEDTARLEALGLPSIPTVAGLASLMGVSVGELRFLTFERAVSQTHHYQRFTIPKKTGGERLICAPMPRLKAAQRWVLDAILAKVPIHDAAHGFAEARSICSNADPHLGQAVVINLDLADFFPSIRWVRVRGLFRSLGYSHQISTILALLCTERPVEEVELDGKTYFVATGERALPQGSPASPAITNLLCRRLDRRLSGLARRHGDSRYTRYADDLTFSSGDRQLATHTLIAAVERIVRDEGFAVRADKTRIMRKGRRQEVTGVIVNDKRSVDRKTLKRFRAVLFQIERDGPAGKRWGRWGEGADLFASLRGYASFVNMVDPDKGRALLERVDALQAKQRYVPPRGQTVVATSSPAAASRRWSLATDLRSRGSVAPDRPEEHRAAPPVNTADATDESTSPGESEDPVGDDAPGPRRWWQFWKR